MNEEIQKKNKELKSYRKETDRKGFNKSSDKPIEVRHFLILRQLLLLIARVHTENLPARHFSLSNVVHKDIRQSLNKNKLTKMP